MVMKAVVNPLCTRAGKKGAPLSFNPIQMGLKLSTPQFSSFRVNKP